MRADRRQRWTSGTAGCGGSRLWTSYGEPMTAEKLATAEKLRADVGPQTSEESRDNMALYNAVMATVVLATFSFSVMATTEGKNHPLLFGVRST